MYLGLDLGTSGLRGLLVDSKGDAIAEATSHYSVNNPRVGWSEQDPTHWITACKTVLGALCAQAPEAMGHLVGLGISGHMHGAVTLDDRGQIIRPCILWNDTRSASEAKELDGKPAFRNLTGNIVFPGFTAPKIAWMARHEPGNYTKIAHVVLPKDYLVFWLTGVITTEVSDASGSSWLDVGKREWSADLIEEGGLRLEQLPPVVEGSNVVGRVKADIAKEFGLPSEVSVVAGGADNACAACGIGALHEGEGFVSLGTSGVILIGKDSYAPEPASAVHTFCHAVSDKWYQMGVILAATDCLEWLAANLSSSAAELDAKLPPMASGPSPLMFLPYLSGERTPHNDADIRGAFVGLARGTKNEDLTQAVMEGVSFALRDCLEALRGTGSNPSSLNRSGNHVQHDVSTGT